jgi:hypothetical protein
MQGSGAKGIMAFANGSSSNVAYSFVGNVGAVTIPLGGSQFRRIAVRAVGLRVYERAALQCL